MTLSIRFFEPIDGAGGAVDPLRIVKDVPFTSGTDNLSPNVLFTALAGQAPFVESFSAVDPAKPAADGGNWQQTFTTSRVYKTFPMVLARYTNTDGTASTTPTGDSTRRPRSLPITATRSCRSSTCSATAAPLRCVTCGPSRAASFASMS